jgi:hypothetical protein
VSLAQWAGKLPSKLSKVTYRSRGASATSAVTAQHFSIGKRRVSRAPVSDKPSFVLLPIRSTKVPDFLWPTALPESVSGEVSGGRSISAEVLLFIWFEPVERWFAPDSCTPSVTN